MNFFKPENTTDNMRAKANDVAASILAVFLCWPTALFLSGPEHTSDAAWAPHMKLHPGTKGRCTQLRGANPLKFHLDDHGERRISQGRQLHTNSLGHLADPKCLHPYLVLRVRGGMGMFDIDDNDPRLKRLLENQVSSE